MDDFKLVWTNIEQNSTAELLVAHEPSNYAARPPQLIAEPASDSQLAFPPCTPNGVVHPSGWFDPTLAWHVGLHDVDSVLGVSTGLAQSSDVEFSVVQDMEGLQYHRAGFDESMNNSASTPFLGPMGQSMTFAPLYASNMIGIDTSFLASADNDMNTFQSHSLTAHDQQPRAIISTANNNPTVTKFKLLLPKKRNWQSEKDSSGSQMKRVRNKRVMNPGIPEYFFPRIDLYQEASGTRESSESDAKRSRAKKACARYTLFKEKCSGTIPCDKCIAVFDRALERRQGQTLLWTSCFDSDVLDRIGFLSQVIEQRNVHLAEENYMGKPFLGKTHLFPQEIFSWGMATSQVLIEATYMDAREADLLDLPRIYLSLYDLIHSSKFWQWAHVILIFSYLNSREYWNELVSMTREDHDQFTVCLFKYTLQQTQYRLGYFLRGKLNPDDLVRFAGNLLALRGLQMLFQTTMGVPNNDMMIRDCSEHVKQYLDYLLSKVRRELPPHALDSVNTFSAMIMIWLDVGKPGLLQRVADNGFTMLEAVETFKLEGFVSDTDEEDDE